MNKEFLQWLEGRIKEAQDDKQQPGASPDDDARHVRATTKWLALVEVQEKIKDILYKEAME